MIGGGACVVGGWDGGILLFTPLIVAWSTKPRAMLGVSVVAIVAATCLMFGATIAERRIANRGFAELLHTGVYGPLNEKPSDAVQRIVQHEKSLLAMINEMLEFVDAERGPVAGASEDILVADPFDDVERLVRQEVARKHLVVQRELAAPRLAVRADPTALQQVLVSLLSNATKYTGDGGTITLGADGDGEKVRMRVSDTGIGIRREEIERIFEPFFQADSGTTRQYSGVGLGLTIARNLVQNMSGEVTIASEVGQGTTATVVLPAATAKPADVAEERPLRVVAA